MSMEIKELRKKLNMTQQELADKLGVAPFTVRRWESGKARPSPLAKRQLARLERKIKG
jgi:putative transcriptional regulator